MARKASNANGAVQAKDSPFDKYSLKDLNDLKLRVEKAIQERQDSERTELRDKFKAMAEEAGFALGEIVGGAKGGRGKAGGVVKFVHPDNPGLTWSGRGRMPKWLSEQVKAGVDPQTFKI